MSANLRYFPSFSLYNHAELMAKPNGRYKRLVESQRRQNTVSLADIKKDMAASKRNEEEVEVDFEKEAEEMASKVTFSHFLLYYDSSATGLPLLPRL